MSWWDILNVVLSSSTTKKLLTSATKELVSRPDLVKSIVAGGSVVVMAVAAFATGYGGAMLVDKIIDRIRVNRLNKQRARELANSMLNKEKMKDRLQKSGFGNLGERIDRGDYAVADAGLGSMIMRDKNNHTIVGWACENGVVAASEVKYDSIDPELDAALNRYRGQVLSLENL